ncbi:MAG: hypothetical protein HKN59_01100 [Gammaproteobacteria bacterium]|nr:hypothetical protein [Gammaproteobacteria bacterium]
MSEAEGLGYDDDLAVAWEAQEVTAEEALQRINADAARLMKAMAAIEEHTRDTSDEASSISQELHRLEGKLDLVLSIVAHMSNAQLALPPAGPVMVRATGLHWHQPPPDLKPGDGEKGVAAIYFYPGMPLPVRLPAKVTVLEDGSMMLVFAGLTAEVRNALERHVFRHHRRAVARAAVARSKG